MDVLSFFRDRRSRDLNQPNFCGCDGSLVLELLLLFWDEVRLGSAGLAFGVESRRRVEMSEICNDEEWTRVCFSMGR